MKALIAHILLFSLLGQIACNPWKFIRPSVNTKTFKRSQPLVSATPLLDPPPGRTRIIANTILRYFTQVKGVVAVITRVEDVALLRILVRKEKEIVMDQVMEVVMMDIKDVKGIFNVEATIAGNLVSTSTKKMIVAKSPQPTPKHLNPKFTSLEHPWNQKKVRQIDSNVCRFC